MVIVMLHKLQSLITMIQTHFSMFTENTDLVDVANQLNYPID